MITIFNIVTSSLMVIGICLLWLQIQKFNGYLLNKNQLSSKDIVELLKTIMWAVFFIALTQFITIGTAIGTEHIGIDPYYQGFNDISGLRQFP